MPATGAMAEKTSARAHAEPVGHERARRHPRGEDPATVDAEVLSEAIGQRHKEAHIVDTLAIGY